MVTSKRNDRDLPASPRYFPRVQTPRFPGGLSCFERTFVPRGHCFADGLLTIYGRRQRHRAPA